MLPLSRVSMIPKVIIITQYHLDKYAYPSPQRNEIFEKTRSFISSQVSQLNRKRKYSFLSSTLTEDLWNIIFSFYEQKEKNFQEALHKFLIERALGRYRHKGLNFLWFKHWENPWEIPYRHILDFSLVRVRINLDTYKKPLIMIYRDQRVELSPQVFLDYGLLAEVYFHYPNQVHHFGRKFEWIINEIFERTSTRWVYAKIQSKAPEWKLDEFLPAQHRIDVMTSSAPPAVSSYGVSCSRPLNLQIARWISYTITRMVSCPFIGLVAEDKIQKFYCLENIVECPMKLYSWHDSEIQRQMRLHDEAIEHEDDNNYVQDMHVENIPF